VSPRSGGRLSGRAASSSSNAELSRPTPSGQGADAPASQGRSCPAAAMNMATSKTRKPMLRLRFDLSKEYHLVGPRRAIQKLFAKSSRSPYRPITAWIFRRNLSAIKCGCLIGMPQRR